MPEEMGKEAKNHNRLPTKKLILVDIGLPVIMGFTYWLLKYYIPTIPQLSSFLRLYFVPWIFLGVILWILGYKKPSIITSAIGSIILVFVVLSIFESGKVGLDSPTKINFVTPKEALQGAISIVDPPSEIRVAIEDADVIRDVGLILDGKRLDVGQIEVKNYNETMWEVTYDPEREFLPSLHTLKVVVTDYHFLSKFKNPQEKEIRFQVVASQLFDKPLGDNYCWTSIRGDFEITKGKLIMNPGSYKQTRIGYSRFRGFFFSNRVNLDMIVYPVFSENKRAVNFIVYFGKNYKLTIGDGGNKLVTLRRFDSEELVDSKSLGGELKDRQGHHIVYKSFLDKKEHAQKFFVSVDKYDTVILSDPDPVTFEGHLGLGVWQGAHAVEIAQLDIWVDQFLAGQ